MPEEGLITEKMRNAIGVESEPVTYDVEKGHIRRFAEAVGDLNPLYTDEAQARRTRHGGVIAPPTFFRAFFAKEPPVSIAQEAPQLKRVLDGGSEWEFHQPIRPGDRVTATAKLANLAVKSGRLGPMLFVSVDHIYKNQFGEVVATQRQNRILY